jgi:uncharacterized RDD family membrane protein YckC
MEGFFNRRRAVDGKGEISMTPVNSNIAEQYVEKVMALIFAPEPEKARIRNELREHLQDGLQGGEDMAALVERMGDPREIAAEFMSAVPFAFAGFWRRLAAFLLDLIVVAVFGGLAAGLAVALSNAVPSHPEGLGENLIGGLIILVLLISSNSAIAVVLMYFPVLEGRFGQTLGKRMLGIVVRSEDGLPVGYWRAFLRRLSFYFELFPFDALFIPFTKKHQRAFDILAKTIVVRGR